MGTGEFPAPHAASIPMRYAVLLRDLRLAVPVFDENFNAEEFATIFGALKGLQVRMVNLEHHLDKIELGMSKLEHRIHAMELHMQQLPPHALAHTVPLPRFLVEHTSADAPVLLGDGV